MIGRPTQNLTGQKFGMLTVVEKVNNERGAKWKCICDCGNITYVYSTALRQAKTKSCGCYKNKYISESKLKDITGKRFGRLIAIKRIGYTPANLSIWECRCDCGNITNATLGGLMNGTTQSCGCLHKETFNSTTHNGSKTRLYRIWNAMKGRCNRPKSINYSYYGGKGIRVCEEWKQFVPFRDWAIANGYADNLVIDRIDSTKDYSPLNCRWITQEDNAREAVKVRERKKENDNKVEV